MIDQAFGWLGQIMGAIGSLVPRLVIVKTSDRALKYRRGNDLVLLGPGLHVYWPLVTELEWCSVVRQIMVHRPHVLETRDGVPVVVSGVTALRIVDPIRYLAENEDPERTMDDAAAAALRQVVVSEDYDTLGQALAATDARLTKATRRALRAFGARVEYTRLTDFARTRTFHLTGLEPGTQPPPHA